MALLPRPRAVWGLLLRTIYVDRHNPASLVDVAVMPVLDLFVWGMMTLWIQRSGTNLPRVLDLVLGARVLWVFLYRSQTTVSLTFLEEIWSRNFVNIFVTPVRLSEFFAATGILAVGKAVLGATVLALATRLFLETDVVSLGVTGFLAMIELLLMGLALGVLTAAMILRWGTGIQALTWALPVALQPLSAVYYPASMLPGPLEQVAYLLPSTHAFEGMRAFLQTGVVPWSILVPGLGLGVLYVIGALVFFERQFEAIRRLGLLARVNA